MPADDLSVEEQRKLDRVASKFSKSEQRKLDRVASKNYEAFMQAAFKKEREKATKHKNYRAALKQHELETKPPGTRHRTHSAKRRANRKASHRR